MWIFPLRLAQQWLLESLSQSQSHKLQRVAFGLDMRMLHLKKDKHICYHSTLLGGL